MRVAIVASHPIQHFVPFYRAIAQIEGIDSKVMFCSTAGLKPYYDTVMGTEISWAMDLTSGYAHEFLPEADRMRESGRSHVRNPSVFAALSRFRPDAVVLYGYAQPTQRFALLWSKLHHKPSLMISDSFDSPRPASVSQTLRRGLLRVAFKAYSRMLTVGDRSEAMYRSYGVPSDKLFRTPFTIDEQAHLAAREGRKAANSKLRTQWGVSQDAVCFLAVGKLTERKRPMIIIDALKAALAQRPDLQGRLSVVVAGNGDQHDAIAKIASNNKLPVTLAGFVNVDRLPEFYAAADVLVHAAGYDPHPLTLSEAAAVGLPLLVSDSVGAIGPTDIAQPGRNTLPFAAGDSTDLAEKMIRLVDDADLRREMSEASMTIFDTGQNTAASVRGLRAALKSLTR